ncbi:pectinesterase inhibitor 3-like [Andrographis paniculata]|uniref:pectinesterase inhibitor 3-like n=1 Tax=Andrographis paniculata TaxID=175694 RepID=UPI0021E7DC45|nr:pectinesterase inhibitor 3-like [Andrographis paniculata]
MIWTVHFHLIIIFSATALSPSIQQTLADLDLVRRSCANATYPEICLHTLSAAGANARTPRELAQSAVGVSLGCARRASGFLAGIKANGKGEEGALRDCLEQMADSVEDLRKTLSALELLSPGGGGSDFRWRMSNAETWVSGALANEDTCLDGFKEIDGRVRSDVRRRITNVARVTSNALYLINLLEHSP